jgi:sulfur relay (sulfurtransferase) DsrF/TusC family protein
MKQVVITIRHAPLATVRTSEALRMALGLTLSDHQVTVLYLEEGSYCGLKLSPEVVSQPGIQQSIEYFEGMKIKQWVEEDHLERWAIPMLRKDVEAIKRKKALSLIQKADVVISF